MIQERLKALRAEMEKRGITVYVVPTADFHESEYVGDHFKARKFITGFTGSAGTAVITLDEAGLWTDGRYFVQAENQLKDSTVTLYRMGEEGVPTVDEFVKDRLKEGGCLGFDGKDCSRKKCVHACDRRPDRSDLGGSSGIVQTAFIYFGGKIFRKEYCG